MKKEKVIKLLGRLKQNNIESQAEVEKVLNYDERVLESLLDLGDRFNCGLSLIKYYSKTEEILKALNILKVSLKVSEKYNTDIFNIVYNILMNKNAIQGGIAIDGAKLILKTKDEVQTNYVSHLLRNAKEAILRNAKEAFLCDYYPRLREYVEFQRYYAFRVYASCVLRDENAIQDGIAMNGAKLILGANKEFQADYASRVLIDENAIKGKIAMDGAKLILEANKEFQADYASLVLRDENAINGNIAMDGAELILGAKEEFHAKFASCVLTDKNAIQKGIAIEGAELILGAKWDSQAFYVSSVLRNENAIKGEIALYRAKLILGTYDEFQYPIIAQQELSSYIDLLILSLNEELSKSKVNRPKRRLKDK